MPMYDDEGRLLVSLGDINAVDVDIVDGGGHYVATEVESALQELGHLTALTVAEVDQLENIGLTTISAAQWGYLGGSSGIDHYVDRGDPAGSDKAVGDFTTDFTWRDLDLSAIVPAGATAIHLRVEVRDNAVESSMSFRKNGNSNVYNAAVAVTQVVDKIMSADLIVSCDANRIIEYRGSNLAFTTIDLIVRGWWIP